MDYVLIKIMYNKNFFFRKFSNTILQKTIGQESMERLLIQLYFLENIEEKMIISQKIVEKMPLKCLNPYTKRIQPIKKFFCRRSYTIEYNSFG